jgi:hypothetical protein
MNKEIDDRKTRNHVQSLPEHSKISFTAKLVAHGRARTDIPFAGDVADAVGAKAVYDETMGPAGGSMGSLDWFDAMLEARYKSLTAAIKRSGCKQVLEFASGVSLRGLALTRSHGLVFVETDLPAISAEKVAIVEKLRHKYAIPVAPNLHFHEANILDWEQIEKALVHFTPGEPVIIIHEGLFPYLTRAEKAIAAKNIHRILGIFGGVWVTPDFHSKDDPITELWSKDAMGVAAKEIGSKTGRDFEDNSFASESDMTAFLSESGFKLKIRVQLDGSFELSSLKQHTIEPAILALLQQHLRLFEMTLA